MQWYYSKAGVQQGPVPESELKAKLASGEVTAADLVWKEGMNDWIPSSRVEALRVVPQQAQTVENAPSGPGQSPYSPPVSTQVSAPGYDGRRIPNYLWQSILVTLLCCVPFGIPAIVYAAKVDGLQMRGDIQGALAASKSAKTWCWVAFGSGLVVNLLVFGLVFLAGVSGNLN